MSLVSESAEITARLRGGLAPAEPSMAGVGDYFELMKPRVMSLVVFTALVGLALAPGHLHPVLAFTAVVSIVTGLLFGLAPAWYAARPDLSRALTDSGRGGSAGARRQRFRRGLVVTQIALALVLVVAAGLLIRSFERMRGVDPGFEPEGLLTARLELSPVRYETNESIRAFFERLVARVEVLPGVRSAASKRCRSISQS